MNVLHPLFTKSRSSATACHGGAGFSESFPGFPEGSPSALRPDTGMKSRLDQVIYDIGPTRFSRPPPTFPTPCGPSPILYVISIKMLVENPLLTSLGKNYRSFFTVRDGDFIFRHDRLIQTRFWFIFNMENRSEKVLPARKFSDEASSFRKK